MYDEMPYERDERRSETFAFTGLMLTVNAIAIVVALSVVELQNKAAIDECLEELARSNDLAVADVLHDPTFDGQVVKCRENVPHKDLQPVWPL